MQEHLKNNNLLKNAEQKEIDATAFGLSWEHIDQLLDQIRSECAEIHEAAEQNDRVHLQEELGDLLLASISLCVFCGMDTQETLHNSCEKFQKRFDCIMKHVREDGYENLKGQPLDVIMHYWNLSKNNC